MNNKVLLKAKPNNRTKSDIEHATTDREIHFGDKDIYAVVLAAAYLGDYGNDGYTTHATEHETVHAASLASLFKHVILDRDGSRYGVVEGRLSIEDGRGIDA